jgi:hypothetical protein
VPDISLIRKYSLLADKSYGGCFKKIDQGHESLCSSFTKFFFGKENDSNEIIAAQHVSPPNPKNATNIISFNKTLHGNDFPLFGICGFFGVLYKKNASNVSSYINVQSTVRVF